MSKTKVLFICTGNSCRSQMAEGLLNDLARATHEAFSAGTHPSHVHPHSITVMEEAGIDITGQTSDPIEPFLDQNMDIVITLCDNALQLCPTFPGQVRQLHWSVNDPFQGWEADPAQLPDYRRTRDELRERITAFLKT